MPVEEFLIDGKPATDLRVVDLKELLEQRGLSKSGSKQVLIARLKESMLSEGRDEIASETAEDAKSENEGRVPNMEMKSCGSNIVAQYLEKQQQALLAAKKAAMQTRASDARHSSNSSSHEESSTVAPIDNGSEKIDHTPSNSPTKRSTECGEKSQKEQTNVELVQARSDEFAVEEVIVVDEGKDPRELSKAAEDVALEYSSEQIGKVDKSQEQNDSNERVAELALEKEDTSIDKAHDVDQRSPNDSEAMSNPSPSESKEIENDKDDRNADIATSESEKGGEIESEPEQSPEQVQMEQNMDHEDAASDVIACSKDVECINTHEIDSASEKPVRKRRWGSTTVGKRATVSISSDSLKDIVGNVKTVDVAMLETQIEEQEEQLDYDDEPIPKRIVVPREDGENEDAAAEPMEKATAATTTSGVVEEEPSTAIQRAKKIKIDEPEVTELFGEECIRVRPASPARRPVDRIIHVHGLTRPFNYKSWLSFLSSFGKFDVQNDFWIDNIKSHCLVKYATTEEATAAREQLDNIKWPKFNSSVLRVEYAGEEDFNRFKKMKEEDTRPTMRNVNGNGQPGETQLRQRQVREIATINDKENDVRRIGRSPKREDQADNKLWPKSREWDRGKGELKLSEQSPPPINTDKRERSGRTETSPFSKKTELKEKAAPTKLLEDLFRKTKTAPFIYWLPLTQEQINEKQQQKLGRDRERSEERRRRPSPHGDRRPRDDFGSRYDRQRRR